METTKQLMERFEKTLKNENSFVKLEIDGLSDFRRSMGAHTIYPEGRQTC